MIHFPSLVKIYTDGGARGNPGPAGIGVVIADIDNQILSEHKKYLGRATNNQAEYEGILLAFQELAPLKTVKEIQLFSDSELLVKQLTGKYRVKNPELQKKYEEIKKLEKFFGNVQYTHIPRAQNKRADRLANEAMDYGMKGSNCI